MNNLPGWKELKPFVFWCSKVLPTVFDESMTYYETLCKVYEILNNVITDVNLLNQAYKNFVDTATTNYEQFVQQITAKVQELETFMNNYFDNLDVQQEINNKLDDMIESGEFQKIIEPLINTPPIKIVASLEDMTDKTYWYILQSNGHIYQWNGQNFADTGLVYTQNTDTYFKRANYPTQAPYSGDLTDLTSIGYYTFYSTANNIAGLPEGFGNYGIELFVLGDCTAQQGGLQIIRSSSNNHLAYRTHYGTSWNEWKILQINDDVLNNVYHHIKTYGITNYSGDLTDLIEVGYYLFAGGDINITGLPEEFGTNNIDLMILSNPAQGLGGIQIIKGTATNHIAYRNHWGNAWTGWKILLNNEDTLSNPYYKQKEYGVTAYNGDLTDLIEVGYYSFFGGNSVITGLPEDFGTNNIELFVLSYAGQGKGGLQIIKSSNGKSIAFRNHWGSGWTAWRVITTNDLQLVDMQAYMGLGDFIACGDSITVSLSYKAQGTYAVVTSWAQHLAKKMGVNTSVYAAGGLTAQNFFDSTNYQAAKEKESQFAIVFLGINDVNRNIPVETFKSYYSQILNGLLEKRKFIFCVTIPKILQPKDSDAYNDAISELCTDNIFLLDIRKYDYLYSAYKNVGHLSGVGYAAFAKVIEITMNEALKNNWFQYNLDFESTIYNAIGYIGNNFLPTSTEPPETSYYTIVQNAFNNPASSRYSINNYLSLSASYYTEDQRELERNNIINNLVNNPDAVILQGGEKQGTTAAKMLNDLCSAIKEKTNIIIYVYGMAEFDFNAPEIISIAGINFIDMSDTKNESNEVMNSTLANRIITLLKSL